MFLLYQTCFGILILLLSTCTYTSTLAINSKHLICLHVLEREKQNKQLPTWMVTFLS